MNEFQGFVSIPALADNTPKSIGRFGELSTYASTFSREKRNFVRDTAPDVEVISFLIRDELLQVVSPTTNFVTQIVELSQFIYNLYKQSNIPTNSNKNAFLNTVRQQYPQFTNITVGELVAGTSPSKNMPDFIQFEGKDGTKDYKVKLWFSDSRFRIQYKDYSIIVIPPVQDIDDLNTGVESIGNVLSQYRSGQIVSRIQNITQEYPQTSLQNVTLKWHDPGNANNTRDTDWSLVIYGQAGIDSDAIKNAIRDYISGNTANNNWGTIYPELYSENEFIFIPFWDNMAFPDNAMDTGIYSSLLTYGNILSKFTKNIPIAYSGVNNLVTYLGNNLIVSSTVYRNLMFGVVGNPNNEGSVFSLRDKYLDYMAVPTLPNHTDFSRMSKTTQEFVLKMNRGFEIARMLSPADNIPDGYGRVVRSEKHYVTFDIHGHTFLILTKNSYVG